MSLDSIVKELSQAQRALERLGGTLATVEFNPNEPASIAAAIHRVEAAIDRAASPYLRNALVKNWTDEMKKVYTAAIQERAAKARQTASSEVGDMDNSVFRQIENTVSDLKWSEINTFGRHIKKLSSILNSPDLKPIADELLGGVDLNVWIKEGEGTQGSMVGSAELNWPQDTKKELGLTIALAHWFAEDPDRAFGFSQKFYYSGRNVNSSLQGMIAQVFVPFGRDFIDYVKGVTGENEPTVPPIQAASTARKIFIVHGHDDAAKESMARFLERIGFETVILHEQASGNKTVIEKIEANSDVGFAVVLLSPDDVGGTVDGVQRSRARQNVILELGYFVGKLGRARVAVFLKGDVEVPSDFGGVVYVPLDGGGAWRQALGKELQEAGFEIDWNRIMQRG
jgi:hypothetical protein